MDMETVTDTIQSPSYRAEMMLKQSNERWQKLLATGSSAVSVEAGQRCPHCRELKEWQIVPHPVQAGRLFAYPLPCGCDGAEKAKRAEQTKQAEIDKRLREKARRDAVARAGLVGRLADCSFDSFKRRQDWRGAAGVSVQVRTYWDAIYQDQFGCKPWLILYGALGTGKTHLAAAVAREAVFAGWGQVYFRSWTEYLKRLQASWDKTPGGERSGDIVEELQKGKLVVIDDIDKKEPRGGWSRDELYPVLNYRYNAKLPTILTFNCAPTDPDPDAPGRMLLARYMSTAIIDRICESAFSIICFDGPSYRSGAKW